MATTQGEKALLSDLNSWQTIFNNLASNYSNGVSTVALTTSNTSITASQINTLHARITSFRADKYLGTQAAWWPTGTNVTVGNPITPANLTAIINTVSNASKVKCKNEASNSSGDCPNGDHNRGNRDNTCKYGTRTSGFLTSGCTSGAMSNGTWNPNGSCTSGKNTDGQSILITCTCTTISK